MAGKAVSIGVRAAALPAGGCACLRSRCACWHRLRCILKYSRLQRSIIYCRMICSGVGEAGSKRAPRRMAKAVFTTKIIPGYDDLPEERYHFPRTYLRAAEQAVGDLIVYYEPRRTTVQLSSRGGRQSYFAVARVEQLVPDQARPDHFYAMVTDFLEFDRPVPFREGSRYYEVRAFGERTALRARGRLVAPFDPSPRSSSRRSCRPALCRRWLKPQSWELRSPDLLRIHRLRSSVPSSRASYRGRFATKHSSATSGLRTTTAAP